MGEFGADFDRAFREEFKNKLWAILDNTKRGGVESRDISPVSPWLMDEYIVLRRLIACQREQKSGKSSNL